MDVLISDISMPEMDGIKLAERVFKSHPRVSVLLISGAVDEAPVVKGGRVRFLKKPFFPAELIKLLREMLADKAEYAWARRYSRRERTAVASRGLPSRVTFTLTSSPGFLARRA